VVVTLEQQQAELMKSTRAAGGDVAAAMAQFRTDHAAEIAQQEAAEANLINMPSYERDQMRLKASQRVQRIREIQAELKAGKDPSEIVPPAE
jgi:U3 small nucleolar ribonucleoprotein component